MSGGSTGGGMERKVDKQVFDLFGLLTGLRGSCPRKTEKPWGHELLWAQCSRYAAKALHIEAGQRLSLQYHRVKEETLLVVTRRRGLQLEREGASMDYHDAVTGTR